MKTSVSVANMLVQIYRYQHKHHLWKYISIGIGWTHIGPTLDMNFIIILLAHTSCCKASSFESEDLCNQQISWAWHIWSYRLNMEINFQVVNKNKNNKNNHHPNSFVWNSKRVGISWAQHNCIEQIKPELNWPKIE